MANSHVTAGKDCCGEARPGAATRSEGAKRGCARLEGVTIAAASRSTDLQHPVFVRKGSLIESTGDGSLVLCLTVNPVGALSTTQSPGGMRHATRSNHPFICPKTGCGSSLGAPIGAEISSVNAAAGPRARTSVMNAHLPRNHVIATLRMLGSAPSRHSARRTGRLRSLGPARSAPGCPHFACAP